MIKKVIVSFILSIIAFCINTTSTDYKLDNIKYDVDKKEDSIITKNTNTNEEKTEIKDESIVDDINNTSTQIIKEENNTNDNYIGNKIINNQTNSNNDYKSNNDANNYVAPRTMTEWEKLGISEWDYYNSPAPNEGELATNINDCDTEANNIISKYKLVAHSGDVYSYSDDYLGCWIVVNMSDGSWMFYNEFKNREKSGEFNYLLRNTN